MRDAELLGTLQHPLVHAARDQDGRTGTDAAEFADQLDAVGLWHLQVEDHRAYFRLLNSWRPDIVAFSCNYLANVPEIVDLAKATKARFSQMFVCVGGHSASFTAGAIIEHGAGAIDCVLKGEGEAAIPLLLAAVEAGRGVGSIPGAVTAAGEGPPPGFVHSLDDLTPARDLLRHRRKSQ